MRRSCAAAPRARARARRFTRVSRARLAKHGLPEAAVQMVPTQDREAVGIMLRDMAGYIDVIVPRGGKGLVARVQQDARVPVMSHLEGICHTYVHAAADLDDGAAHREERQAAAHRHLRRHRDDPHRSRVRRDASAADRPRSHRRGLRGSRRRAHASERPPRARGRRRRLGQGVSRRHRRDSHRRRRSTRRSSTSAATGLRTPTRSSRTMPRPRSGS